METHLRTELVLDAYADLVLNDEIGPTLSAVVPAN